MNAGLELLEESEAIRLSPTAEVGRVGLNDRCGPSKFIPVNYRMVDGSIVFRSSPGSKLSAAASGPWSRHFEGTTTTTPPTDGLDVLAIQTFRGRSATWT